MKIYSHGTKVLKQKGEHISPEYPELQKIIEDMYNTLRHTNGIGLSAHQVGIPIKLFIVDLGEVITGFQKVFINSEIIEVSKDTETFEEGCLSFPGLFMNIERPKKVKIKYLDENFKLHEEWFDGLPAIVIQHEHDHTEGIVFTDRISSLRKKLIESKLLKITRGKINPGYPMQLP